MSTDRDSQESGVRSQELNPPFDKGGVGGFFKWSFLRRFVLLGIIILFLLQFFRMKVLVGGLTGSLAVWSLNFIDVFAWLETLAASKSFTFQALLAVLPVIGIYLIFGRAFCGWVCPMDFLFELVSKIKSRQLPVGAIHESPVQKIKARAQHAVPLQNIPPNIGYGIAAALLIISGILGVPFFTRYLSHLTNFFMVFNSSVFLALDLPVSKTVLIYSGAVILSLILLEYFAPRLWCKILCPVGTTYGLFNKLSLLKLRFKEGNCGECNLCEQVCYMDVRITPYLDQPGLRDTNCIYCGRCVEGCGTKGKLIRMNFKSP
ncbi:MAG: 4Fe-4S binding protein [Nitrospirae bacterium]|nr:4Fe-4S binding protein [Nitrospirota bacterium]